MQSLATVPKACYTERRKKLQNKIGPKSIVFVSAAKMTFRNRDCHYPFRQNSHFYYLTGFAEADSILVLARGQFLLFAQESNSVLEGFSGKRCGLNLAKESLGADAVFSITEFENKLAEIIKPYEKIYFPFSEDEVLENLMLSILRKFKNEIEEGDIAAKSLHDVSLILNEMRLIKDKHEILAIRKAIELTVKGYLRAMQFCRPGLYEYELEAEFMHEFIKNGVRSTVFQNIVASGNNTCILHYTDNNKKIHNGDLVLIDGGAEYQYYAADIARTFPANGIFTAEQRIIYEIVLSAQKAAIKATKPGVSWDIISYVLAKTITEGLIKIGLLEGKLQELMDRQAYEPFYPHSPGHWLGLDVHDVGPYRCQPKNTGILFKPGTVITMEPGIYISSYLPNIPARWRNIGIRIEDELLITKTGCEVLSRALPSKVAEIESLMVL